MRPSVRTLAKASPIAAAIATNTAVQVPCVETAFRPIDTPSIQAEASGQEFAANRSKHDTASVIDVVDGGVIKLEFANFVSSPGGDGSDKE
jgi:hypothetical protein